MTRAIATLVAIVALVAGARAAEGHQSSVTYSTARVDGDRVHYRILIDPIDASVLTGGSDRTPLELTPAAAAALAAAVPPKVAISDGDTPCAAGPGAVELDDRRLAVAWTAACPAPVAVLVIHYDLLFDDDRQHTAALRVEVPARDPASTLLDLDHARFVWDLHGAAPSGVLAFVRSGVEHVAGGLDHIAFVLALLLAVVLVRGPGGEWRVRPLLQALKATALLASAFTLAHSLTLIAAALGWVAVPARLVETAIALSIVWTAVEDMVRPDVRWRFALTFAFGLMHGLGFARMLAVLLPPSDRVVPLLAFNVGVELGHLAVIAIALPLLWLVARRVGAHRYRTVVLPVAAGALAVLGAIWMIERVLEVTVLGL